MDLGLDILGREAEDKETFATNRHFRIEIMKRIDCKRASGLVSSGVGSIGAFFGFYGARAGAVLSGHLP